MAEVSCCFKDCLYYEEECSTCPFPTKDITSGVCRDLVERVCTGKEGEREFINAWTLNGVHGLPPCVYYLSRRLLKPTPPNIWNILERPPPSVLFDSAGAIVTLREFLRKTVQGLESFGYKIGAPPNSLQFSPVEYSLYSVCRNVPGICSTFLPEVCLPYKGEDLIRIPSLANWCGCYLPEEEYSFYVNAYQVTKECTPYCSRQEAIPLPTPSSTEISSCLQSVCILDKVAIELVNSTIRTGAKFIQICGSCGVAGRCSCISSDSNLTIINSRVGGIDFLQECGGNSKCTTRVGTIILEVPCEEAKDIEEKVSSEIENALSKKNGIILFSILGALILLGVIWWLLSLI